jgi:hypothetical protein
MNYGTWQDKLKTVFNDPGFATPDDVTPEKFHVRLEDAGITLPSDVATQLKSFQRDASAAAPKDRARLENEWRTLVKSLWALTYHDDPDNEERWLKAYSDEEWAQAHPGRNKSQIDSEELTRLRRRFIYRKMAGHYERFFRWRSALFPGWII